MIHYFNASLRFYESFTNNKITNKNFWIAKTVFFIKFVTKKLLAFFINFRWIQAKF